MELHWDKNYSHPTDFIFIHPRRGIDKGVKGIYTLSSPKFRYFPFGTFGTDRYNISNILKSLNIHRVS